MKFTQPPESHHPRYTLLLISMGLSLLFHLVSYGPAWNNLLTPSGNQDDQLPDSPALEFEFYQAKSATPRMALPENLIERIELKNEDPDITLPSMDSLSSDESFIQQEKSWDTPLSLNPVPIEDIPLPGEEDYLQHQTKSKITEALKTTSVRDEPADNTQEDYWQRIRNLIYTKLSFPAELKSQHIEDTLKVEITLNKQGQLIKSLIPPEYASRYEAFNREALQAVASASSFFPPLPATYTEDLITFTVAIDFGSG